MYRIDYTKSNNNIMTENIFPCRLHLRCTTLDSISILRKSEFGKIKIDKLFWLLVSNKRRRSHNPLKVKDHSVHQTKLCVWSLLQICVGLVTNRILSDEEKKHWLQDELSTYFDFYYQKRLLKNSSSSTNSNKRYTLMNF